VFVSSGGWRLANPFERQTAGLESKKSKNEAEMNWGDLFCKLLKVK